MLSVVVLGSATTGSAGILDLFKPRAIERDAKKQPKPDGPRVFKLVADEVVPGTPVAVLDQPVEPAAQLTAKSVLTPVSFRRQVPPAPTGGPLLAPEPASAASEPVPAAAAPQVIELYPCVQYSDGDNVHPCAVHTVVAVKDPTCCSHPCDCCQPACVYVEICVPPNCTYCYDVKRHDGSKVEYDYGDYEIEITSRNGVVYLDYDDYGI
jgi:hypothetical protein